MSLHCYTGCDDMGRVHEEALEAALSAVNGIFLPEQWPADTCIVGGFYRDIATGRTFKDVDVFIPGDGDPADDDIEYEIGRNEIIHQDGFEINVIWMPGAHTLESLLDRLDIGICQIGAYLNSPTEVYVTDTFLRDTLNDTLTVTRPSRWNHIDRVMQKFPDHRLIDPWPTHKGTRSVF